MCVDSHRRLVVNDACDHVRGFPPHPRKPCQQRDLGRYLASEFFHQHARHSGKMTGLAVRVADAFNVFIQGLGCRLRHVRGRREVPEQGRGDHVHPLVGALGAEHYGHQQLKGIAVAELGLRRRVMRLKVVKHFLESLCPVHGPKCKS